MEKVKERIYYFDNLKAILIFFVVFGHLLLAFQYDNIYIAKLIDLIYVFHMPLFVFVSGYFSKFDNKNIVTSFLIPYIFFNFLYGFLFSDEFGFSIIYPHFAYWFLISLICWKLIIKYLDKVKGIFIISIIIAVLAGTHHEITSAFSFARTLKFLPFFILGYKFNKDWINNIKRVPKLFVGLLILFSFLLFLFAEKYNLINYSLLMKAQYYFISGYTDLDGIINTVFIVFPLTFLFMFIIMYLVPRKKILLTYIGKNTMTIFLLHCFIFGVFIRVIGSYPIFNTISAVLFCFFSSILICLVLGSNFVSKLYKIIQKGIEKLFLKNSAF